jgi:serine/threonine protein kinase
LIKFSPSAKRSDQLEEIINLMMEPNPEVRPSVDELLMHPRLQVIAGSMSKGIKKTLNLNMFSPLVEKLRNPLSTKA